MQDCIVDVFSALARDLVDPATVRRFLDAGYFLGDLEGGVGFTSHTLTRLGFTDEEMRDGRYQERIHPEDQASYRQLWERVNEGWENELYCEYRVRDANGRWSWIQTHAVVISRCSDGSIGRVFGTDRDISSAKSAENFLRRQHLESRKRYEIAESLRKTGTLVLSDLELTDSIAIALQRLRPIISFDWCDVYTLQYDGTLQPLWQQERSAGELPDADTLFRSLRTGAYPVIRDDVGDCYVARSWMGVPLLVDDTLVGALFVWQRDPGFFHGGDIYPVMAFAESLAVAVKNHQRFRNTVKELETDYLTGFLTRTSFSRDAARRWTDFCALFPENSVAMIDIDHFKAINDTFGHEAGDRVIRTIAGVINTSVRSGDVVGRYGGEEFVIVLPNSGAKEAGAIMDRVRSACECLDRSGLSGPVTISAGIATASGVTALTEVIAAADRALYRAKQSGRNRIVSIRA